MSYLVKMMWDDEAKVWIATSDDVPGLVLESESLDTLVNKVKIAIPELLSFSGAPLSAYTLNINASQTLAAAYG